MNYTRFSAQPITDSAQEGQPPIRTRHGQGRGQDKQGRQEVGAQDSREVIIETANHGLGLKKARGRGGWSSRTVMFVMGGGWGGET